MRAHPENGGPSGQVLELSNDEVRVAGGIKSMISVKRLGHATLATPDIERQADYWTAVMGLQEVHRSKNFVLLATKLGQEAIALEAGSGTPRQCGSGREIP